MRDKYTLTYFLYFITIQYIVFGTLTKKTQLLYHYCQIKD